MAKPTTGGIAGRLFRGYGPLIGFAAMFTAMALLVPSVDKELVRQVNVDPATMTEAASGDEADGAASEVLDETAIAADDTVVDPLAAGDGTDPASAAGGGALGSATARTGGAAAKAGSPGAPGQAQACTGRQVKADPYSPPCRTWTGGDNGGATSQGVTGTDIVISVRIQSFASGLVDAISKKAGAELPPEDESDIVRTLEGLVEYFNKAYQFYGRKLKLEIYTGRGDVLKEALGGGQEFARNDALKVAQEIKAFADVSAITPPYIDALASQRVIAVGAPYLSRAWMTQRAPYVWSQFIDCSAIAENVTSYYLSRMAGKPAQNAGGSLSSQPRKLGIVVPNSSWYQDCLQDGLNQLRKGGVEPADVVPYTPDLNTMTTQSATIISRLQQAGVTSVACFCDPLLLGVLTPKASEQNYTPEWLNTGVALTDQDIVGRLFDKNQWSRSIGISYSGATVAQGRGVGYSAYKAVRKDEPSIGVDLMYAQLQLVAIGVQMAGPKLNPAEFQRGMFEYPESKGQLGTWKFGPGDYTTSEDSREIYWNPNQKSIQTGKAGAYVETEPNRRYRIGEYGPSGGLIPGIGG